MRNVALGLQYAYTNGACRVFAEAALALGTCEGAIMIAVEDETRDHCFVRLPDGRALDAEGVRSVETLLRDFGLPLGTPIKTVDHREGGGEHVARLREHLVELGWDDALPEQDRNSCASTRFAAARRDFDRLGGWDGDPLAAIEAARDRKGMAA